VAVLAACAAVNGDTVVTRMISVVLVVKADLAMVHHHLLHLVRAQRVAEAIGLAPITAAVLLALTMETVLLAKRASRI